jgi:uncharacterized membrane protein
LYLFFLFYLLLSLVLDTWGLDNKNNFFVPTSKTSWLSLSNTIHHSVEDVIRDEMKEIQNDLIKEKIRFRHSLLQQTEKMKMKRLLFLFQKDLIPGISGEILDSKDQRDHVVLSPVSAWKKGFAWCFLGMANLGMLFYVFLFAVSQDSHHQSAWGKSFGLWLLLDIVLVSSATVVFMHIFLPSLLMKDVTKIKRKLMESIANYYETMDRSKQQQQQHQQGKERNHRYAFNADDDEEDDLSGDLSTEEESLEEKPITFNAATYLFLSYRVASLYPELKASQVILQFSTPWPRQSYQHITDLKTNYENSLSTALSRSVAIILVFLLTSLLSVPLAIQDMILHLCMTAMMGYSLLIHIQLYEIFPVLVIIPTLFFLFLVHFLYTSMKKLDLLEKVNFKKMLEKGVEGRKGERAEEEAEEKKETDKKKKGEKKEKSKKQVRFVTRKQSVIDGVKLSNQLKKTASVVLEGFEQEEGDGDNEDNYLDGRDMYDDGDDDLDLMSSLNSSFIGDNTLDDGGDLLFEDAGDVDELFEDDFLDDDFDDLDAGLYIVLDEIAAVGEEKDDFLNDERMQDDYDDEDEDFGKEGTGKQNL